MALIVSMPYTTSSYTRLNPHTLTHTQQLTHVQMRPQVVQHGAHRVHAVHHKQLHKA